MTGEEIKDELYRMLSDVLNGNGPIRNNAQRGRYREAVKSAIEALEQKPTCPSEGVDPAYEKTLNKWIGAEVLDRIRNEMHATAEKHEDGVYYLRDEWVDEIIDKYAERSDKK